MSEPVSEPVDEPPNTSSDEEDARQRAEQDRRRRQVFGDVLDGATMDDRPDPPRSGSDAAGSREDPGERWLRENVPPHHGG